MAHLPYQKYEDEEFWIYHDFKRRDNYGWLENAETIANVEVNIIDSTGEPVPSMRSGATADGTKALVRIEGGEAGQEYTIQFIITTSAGQVFEDRVSLSIKE